MLGSALNRKLLISDAECTVNFPSSFLSPFLSSASITGSFQRNGFLLGDYNRAQIDDATAYYYAVMQFHGTVLSFAQSDGPQDIQNLVAKFIALHRRIPAELAFSHTSSMQILSDYYRVEVNILLYGTHILLQMPFIIDWVHGGPQAINLLTNDLRDAAFIVNQSVMYLYEILEKLTVDNPQFLNISPAIALPLVAASLASIVLLLRNQNSTSAVSITGYLQCNCFLGALKVISRKWPFFKTHHEK